MAKTSMINREIKREKLAKQHGAKREALKKIISSTTASYEEKIEAATKLQKLPRDSSPSRQRNRCELSGRSRGVYRKFGLGRNMLRKATNRVGESARLAGCFNRRAPFRVAARQLNSQSRGYRCYS